MVEEHRVEEKSLASGGRTCTSSQWKSGTQGTVWATNTGTKDATNESKKVPVAEAKKNKESISL